jgi:uncharacterized protein YdeI (YjbR/CyaY-like superfamily)
VVVAPALVLASDVVGPDVVAPAAGASVSVGFVPAASRVEAEPHAASSAPSDAARKLRRSGTSARYRPDRRGRAQQGYVSAMATDEVRDGQPVLTFADQAAWERWLEANHEIARGVWAKLAKKSTGIASVQYPEVLDTALCFGWIDGQRVSHDATYFLQRFCPRTAKSPWSQINVAKVDALIAAGRMRPAGQAAIDRAKADGRWDRAYEPASQATVPADLQARLDATPAAAAFFATLDSRNRYAVLYRLQDAKRPETRAKRLEQFVAMLARRETLH